MSDFFIYNTKSRSQEVFIPQHAASVSIYSCGPTVYNTAHIGNLRAFLFADTLQRWLRFGLRYSVQWVMNITDIDDKTIRDSQLKYPNEDPKKALQLLTQYYADIFFDDLKKIGIQKDHFFQVPYATHYIPHMQELIQKIIDNGYAYIADGSVYLDVQKYRKEYSYGVLVDLHFDDMVSTARVENDEYDKASACDFVLWKGKKESEPFWDFTVITSDGPLQIPGRPGWHIECSAMSKDVFKNLPFDIHTGGVDLCFPHHEDEICQMKAAFGDDTAVYWMHNEHLMVEGKKMSKSLGNFYILPNLIAKGVSPEVVRFLMVTNHYRTKLNLSDESLEMAKNTLTNLRHMLSKVSALKDGIPLSEVVSMKADFMKAMNDDLNVSVAMAVLFSAVKKASQYGIANDSLDFWRDFVELVENVFGVYLITQKKEVPIPIITLAEQRQNARLDKNWAESDRLREELLSLGWAVKDSKDGFTLESL